MAPHFELRQLESRRHRRLPTVAQFLPPPPPPPSPGTGEGGVPPCIVIREQRSRRRLDARMPILAAVVPPVDAQHYPAQFRNPTHYRPSRLWARYPLFEAAPVIAPPPTVGGVPPAAYWLRTDPRRRSDIFRTIRMPWGPGDMPSGPTPSDRIEIRPQAFRRERTSYKLRVVQYPPVYPSTPVAPAQPFAAWIPPALNRRRGWRRLRRVPELNLYETTPLVPEQPLAAWLPPPVFRRTGYTNLAVPLSSPQYPAPVPTPALWPAGVMVETNIVKHTRYTLQTVVHLPAYPRIIVAAGPFTGRRHIAPFLD